MSSATTRGSYPKVLLINGKPLVTCKRPSTSFSSKKSQVSAKKSSKSFDRETGSGAYQ